MSFIFISHASDDKPKIGPLVRALVEANDKIEPKTDIKFWLDKPQECGFSRDEIDKHFQYIEIGENWTDHIVKAAREAAVILVCWSEIANQTRDVWEQEANYARMEGKYIGCIVGDIAPAQLRPLYRDLQVIDVRSELPAPPGQPGAAPNGRIRRPEENVRSSFHMLVQTLRKRMRTVETKKFKKRASNGAIQPDVPYLVDRDHHELEVKEGIDRVAKDGGTRCYFLTGPENECPDKFVERIQKHLKRFNPLWPKRCKPAEFKIRFQRALIDQLKLPQTSSQEDVARKLAEFGCPIGIVSDMSASEWQANEPARLKEWLSYWHDLERHGARLKLIPIIYVKMSETVPGWEECPPGTSRGASISNETIWSEACALQFVDRGSPLLPRFLRRKEPRENFKALDVLMPINEGDAGRWMKDQSSKKKELEPAMRSVIKTLYSSDSASRHGVSLADFAKAMNELSDSN